MFQNFLIYIDQLLLSLFFQIHVHLIHVQLLQLSVKKFSFSHHNFNTSNKNLQDFCKLPDLPDQIKKDISGWVKLVPVPLSTEHGLYFTSEIYVISYCSGLKRSSVLHYIYIRKLTTYFKYNGALIYVKPLHGDSRNLTIFLFILII